MIVYTVLYTIWYTIFYTFLWCCFLCLRLGASPASGPSWSFGLGHLACLAALCPRDRRLRLVPAPVAEELAFRHHVLATVWEGLEFIYNFIYNCIYSFIYNFIYKLIYDLIYNCICDFIYGFIYTSLYI